MGNDRKTRTRYALWKRNHVLDEVPTCYFDQISGLKKEWLCGLLMCSMRRSAHRFQRDVFAAHCVDAHALLLALCKIAVITQYIQAKTGWGSRAILGDDVCRVFLDAVLDAASLVYDEKDAEFIETECKEVTDSREAPLFNLPQDVLQSSMEDWFSKRWDDMCGYTDLDLSMEFGCTIASARKCCMALKAKGKISAMTIPYFVPLFQHCDAPCPPVLMSELTGNVLHISGIQDKSPWQALEQIEQAAIAMDKIYPL